MTTWIEIAYSVSKCCYRYIHFLFVICRFPLKYPFSLHGWSFKVTHAQNSVSANNDLVLAKYESLVENIMYWLVSFLSLPRRGVDLLVQASSTQEPPDHLVVHHVLSASADEIYQCSAETAEAIKPAACSTLHYFLVSTFPISISVTEKRGRDIFNFKCQNEICQKMTFSLFEFWKSFVYWIFDSRVVNQWGKLWKSFRLHLIAYRMSSQSGVIFW